VSPDRHRLFAATKGGEGASLVALDIDPRTGELSPTAGAEPTPVTDGPAYLTTDRAGRWLLHASYGGHSVAVHSIGVGGTVSAEMQRVGVSENSHCVMADPTNRFVYVPCIAQAGGDAGNAIHCFRLNGGSGHLEEMPKLTPPRTAPGLNRFGTRGELGPRHLVFHPYLPVLFTANEQGNSVSCWSMDVDSGALSHVQTVSTVPDDFCDTSHCSEIQIHPSGRFILAPNRGHNSIAVFEVDGATGTGPRNTRDFPQMWEIRCENPLICLSQGGCVRHAELLWTTSRR
jgi:6-phosphogluconolactonase